MPTRKVSERERLTLYARQATDDQLEEATEILRIEQRARAATKPKKAAPKPATPKPANKPTAPAKDGVITDDQQ